MPEPIDPGQLEDLTQKVNAFARAARVENVVGSVCGDGGVTKTLLTTKGQEIAVAGFAGDLGQDLATVVAVMAYKKAHGRVYEPAALTREIAEAFAEAVGGFMFHTANHIEPPEKITDCGDMHGKMSDERYGLDREEVRRVIEAAQALAKEDVTGEIIEQTLGDRHHEEQGVLIVEGKTHSLVHWLPEGDAAGMWFVLDPKRAKARREAVLASLGYESEAIEEITALKAKHDGVTNSCLAVGKQVFGVNVDDAKKIEVRYLGQVQEDGQMV